MALTCASNFIDIAEISKGTNPMLTLTVLQLMIIGVPSVFFCLLHGSEYQKKLRIQLIPARHLTMTVYALAFTLFGNMTLSLIMYKLFPQAFAADSASSYTAYSIEETGGAIYAAIALAIVPAILEEFLFRGIISAEYDRYGYAASVIMSSAMFAMLHMSFVKLPVFFFTGVVLALTASATKSIFASMLVHALNNIFVLFFQPYIYKIAAKSESGIILLMFIIVTLLLVFALLFFAKAQRLYSDRAYANEAPPMILRRRENEFPLLVQCLLSPTFITLCVFFIVVSAVNF